MHSGSAPAWSTHGGDTHKPDYCPLLRRHACSYVAMSNLSASLIQFPLAYLMLRLAPQTQPQPADAPSAPSGTHAGGADAATRSSQARTGGTTSTSSGFAGTNEGNGGKGMSQAHADDAGALAEVSHSASSTSHSASSTSGATVDATQHGGSSGVDSGGQLGAPQGLGGWWAQWGPLVKGILTPPTIACCLALVVASNPPWQVGRQNKACNAKTTHICRRPRGIVRMPAA